MADEAKTVVLIDQHEAMRRAAEERQRAIEAGEVPQLDKTIPGGLYKSADGRWHDAHGDEVTEGGELVAEQRFALPPAPVAQTGGPEVTDAVKAGENDEGDEAWRADMKDQRRESMANPVEGAPVGGDVMLPPLDDEEDELDESGAKTGRKVKKSARKRARK